MAIWVDFSLTLRDYSLDFFLAQTDAIDPISSMYNVGEILNLNEFSDE